MKKFIVQCAYMLALLVVFIITSAFCLKYIDLDNYLLANIDKNKRIASLPFNRPKLVLIGGSNLAFGLNSQILADSLPYFPINMGLHAGLGLNYMMHEVTPYLKSGDILLIIPEYEQFTSKLFYGEGILTEMLMREGKYAELLDGAFRHCSDILDALRFVRVALISNNTPDYSRCSFNNYGDATGHWTLPSKPIFDKSLIGEPQEEIVKEIAAYVYKLEQRDIKCYVFPPAYKNGCALLSSGFINCTETLLRKEDIAFQESPARYIFDDSLFYDTTYHLSKEGVDRRTKLLVTDIKKMLYTKE